MKRLAFIFLTLFLFSCAAFFPPPSPPCPDYPSLAVYFSPPGEATEAIVQEMDKAQKSILVQAYSFTSAPIAKGLVAAQSSSQREKATIVMYWLNSSGQLQ